MAHINLEAMDSRDVKSLFGPLAIAHPPKGNRQTAEYNRTLRAWIAFDPESRFSRVISLIEKQRLTPGGRPSAMVRPPP